MKILVINCGSSSLKFQLIDTSPEQIGMNTDQLLAKGEVERLGSSESILNYECEGGEKQRVSKPLRDHDQAIQFEKVQVRNHLLREVNPVIWRKACGAGSQVWWQISHTHTRRIGTS